MSKIALFVAELLNRVGEYKPNNRNMGALSFIQKGAGLGLQAFEKLPMAIAAHEKHAANLLNTRGDDSGYRTLLIVAELLIPAATKQLYFAQREADRKDAVRIRSVGYSLDGLGKEQPNVDISADAWAETTTIDLGADAEKHPGNDMGFETRDMENVEPDMPVRHSIEDITGYIEQLVAVFTAPALRADHICNSWRNDYSIRPAIPYVIVPRLDGGYTYGDSLEKALQMLAVMEEERARNGRQQQLRQIAASADSWGTAVATKAPAKIVAA